MSVDHNSRNAKKSADWRRRNPGAASKATLKWQHNNPIKHKWYTYQKSARRRDIEFNISHEAFTRLLTGSCIYCGSNEQIGLDRVDNNAGYTESNCAPCCKLCNKMKSTLNCTIWISHVMKIAAFSKTYLPA